MKRPYRRVMQHLLYGVLLAFAAQPGCGGGCSLTNGIDPIAAPLPGETILENGIQIRLTRDGFSFVEDNLGSIVESLLGDHICVPPDLVVSLLGVDFTICPSDPLEGPAFTCDGLPGCRVDLNIDSSNFGLEQDGNGTALLGMSIQFDAGVGVAQQSDGICELEPPIDKGCNGPQCDCAAGRINTDIDLNPFGDGSTCDLVFGARDFTLDAEISLFVDGNRQLAVELQNLNLVGQLDDSNTVEVGAFEENRGDPGIISQCNTLDETLELGQSTIVGFFLGFFEGAINGLINDQIQAFLPAPPGIEGIIDLGAILGGILPLNLNGSIELSLIAGGYAEVETSLNNLGGNQLDRGLSLGMRAGVNSDFTPGVQSDGRSTPNPCVRTLPLPLPGVPNQAAAGERFFERTEEFAQNVIPGTSTTYDLGIGVSEAFLDSFGFHAFNSGMFCLQIGSDVLGAELLSSDTLALLLPSVRDLVPATDGVLPVFIQLRPQNPPDFTIGNGGANDPLVGIALDNLALDMYTQLDDRLVRLFTADTSLLLGIDLTVDANAGAIVPTIDTSQLGDVEVTISNNELLQEDAQAIESLIPTLLQIALPALANVIGPIQTPIVGGFTVDLGNTSIQKVEAVVGDLGVERFLGLFAGLVFDPNAVGNKINEDILVSTKAKLDTLHVPDSDKFASAMKASDWPGVQLDLNGESKNGNPLEWQFRVDRGVWTPFTQDANPILKQPIFLLQGEHVVEVRAQEVGNPVTLDPTPVELLVRLDTVEPRVTMKAVEQGIRAQYSDVGTRKDLLKTAYRIDGGDWVELARDGMIPSSALGGASMVEVQVSDEAGHVSVRTLEVEGTPVAAGCSVGAQDSGAGVVVMFALFFGAILFIRRRRQYFQTAFLGLVILFGQGCACNNVVCALDSDCASLNCNDGEVAFCDIADTGFCQCGPPQGIETGAAGRFADIASDGEEAVVVAYNQTFGDLVFARVTPPVENETNFIFVDGVPDGPVVGDPGDVRGGIRDPGQDVGQDASVTVDAEGNAHIAYLDVSNGDLKYARVNKAGDEVISMAVDTDSGFVGRYTDIVIGTDGTPQISYMAVDVQGSSQLRFVKANVDAPEATNDWGAPLIIDSAAAIAPNPPNLLETPKGTGLFTSMDITFDGRTQIAYHDSINQDAKQAESNNDNLDSFTIVKLDEDNNGDIGSLGQHISMVSFGDNRTAQAMLNLDDGSLLFFGDFSGNFIETVDNGVVIESGVPVIHKIGADATVFTSIVDGTRQFFVAYHDSTSFDAIISKRDNQTGIWTPSVVSGDEDSFEGSKGFFTTVFVSGNNPNVAFLANLVLDQQDGKTALEILSIDLTALP